VPTRQSRANIPRERKYFSSIVVGGGSLPTLPSPLVGEGGGGPTPSRQHPNRILAWQGVIPQQVLTPAAPLPPPLAARGRVNQPFRQHSSGGSRLPSSPTQVVGGGGACSHPCTAVSIRARHAFDLYQECVQAGQWARLVLEQKQGGEHISFSRRPPAAAASAAAARGRQRSTTAARTAAVGGQKPPTAAASAAAARGRQRPTTAARAAAVGGQKPPTAAARAAAADSQRKPPRRPDNKKRAEHKRRRWQSLRRDQQAPNSTADGTIAAAAAAAAAAVAAAAPAAACSSQVISPWARKKRKAMSPDLPVAAATTAATTAADPDFGRVVQLDGAGGSPPSSPEAAASTAAAYLGSAPVMQLAIAPDPTPEVDLVAKGTCLQLAIAPDPTPEVDLVAKGTCLQLAIAPNPPPPPPWSKYLPSHWRTVICKMCLADCHGTGFRTCRNCYER